METLSRIVGGAAGLRQRWSACCVTARLCLGPDRLFGRRSKDERSDKTPDHAVGPVPFRRGHLAKRIALTTL
jgi:hypothetical protein